MGQPRIIRITALSLALPLLLAASPVAAQEAVAQEAAAPTETFDVAAETFDVTAATEAYLALLSPEQRENSDNYFEGGYWLELWGFLYGMAVAWLLLGTRLSARMRDFAQRLGRWRPLATLLYALQYIVLTTLLTFPLSLYQGYFREHQYGLSNLSLGEWLRDQGVGLLVGALFGGLFLMVLYGIFRKAPRTWWIWGTALAISFLVFGMLIAPVYISPLFNTYNLLEDKAVLDPILEMARANGVDVDRVYQFDASRQSKRISANVSGFAGTMRISLNDNLLERCDLGEVQAVMGHELGHYVLNHVYESVLFFCLILLVGFGFLHWSFEACVTRWGKRWDVHGISDVAGLPLLVALLSIFFFILTPFLNTYIRVNEAEADIFGLNAARQPDGFASTAIKLSEYRKLNPGPIEEWIFFDHPSGRARVHMAMQWKAENLEKSVSLIDNEVP